MNIAHPGVYMILNIITNARYVGSTPRTIGKRWAEHKCALKNNRHGNRNLQKAWNDNGQNALALIVLENTSDNCLEREQYWMDFFRSNGETLYNLCPNSDSHKGLIMPEHVGRTVAEAQRLRRANMTIEEKENYSKKMQDIFNDPAMKDKISNAIRVGYKKRNLARNPVYLRSPQGDTVPVYERYNFSLENGLDPSAITAVINKRRPSHKGWTLAQESHL